MTERDDLLTVDEAAAIIQVTPRWLHARIARGELPAVEVGGKRHVREADLNAWVEAQRIVPRPTDRRI